MIEQAVAGIEPRDSSGGFSAAGPAARVVDAGDGAKVLLPIELLQDGDYARHGNDLILTGADGSSLLVRGFFAAEGAWLESFGGSIVDAVWAAKLAQAGAPLNLAQAGAGEALKVIGKVEAAAGPVVAIHLDGTRTTLSKDSPVHFGDVIESEAGGKVALILEDETSFSLGPNGRLVLDEFVYDPGAGTGKVAVSVLKGGFAFISGKVAKSGTEAMSVKTPVATMGIRGTKVGGRAASEGEKSKFVLLAEADGKVGKILVVTQAGTQLLDQPNQGTEMTSAYEPPSQPVILSDEEVKAEFSSTVNILSDSPTQQDSVSQPDDQASNSDSSSSSSEPSPIGNPDNPQTVTESDQPEIEIVLADIGDLNNALVTAGTDDDDNGEVGGGDAGDNDVEPITLDFGPPDEGDDDDDDDDDEADTSEVLGPPDQPDDGGNLHLVGDDNVNILVGGAGNEIIEGFGGSDFLDGGAGDDTILGGDDGDQIVAGDGDDTVAGGAGGDQIIGGSGLGNDTYFGDQLGDSTSSGLDFDILIYSSATSDVQVDLTANTAFGADIGTDTVFGFEMVTGGDGNDVIFGNGADNLIDGGAGDDILEGVLGADTLQGGIGVDAVGYTRHAAGVMVNLFAGTVTGGDDGAADIVVDIEDALGGSGNDTLIGDANTNLLAGNIGNDTLDGNAGDDTLTGGFGNDTLAGGAGSDDFILALDAGNDTVFGNTLGDASAAAGDFDRVIFLGSGLGVFVDLGSGFATGADIGTDSLAGIVDALGTGQGDTIVGSALDNVLDGDAGNDTLVGGDGPDTLIGGAGIDMVLYTGSTTAVDVNLTTGVHVGGEAQNDVLSGIEFVMASLLGDTLTGDAAANLLDGTDGNDTLDGRDGDDTVIGGNGDDSVAGGDGDDMIIGGVGAGNDVYFGDSLGDSLGTLGGFDTVVYLSAVSGALVDMSAGTASGAEIGSDTLFGIEAVVMGSGNDTLIGSGGVDILLAGGGDDTVEGGAFGDSLDGGAGTDMLSYVSDSIGVFVDLTASTASGGQAQGDIILGFEQAFAGLGDDTLIGAAAGNVLFGSDGNDTLQPGLSADLADGGLGNDTIVYSDHATALVVDLSTQTVFDGTDTDILADVENVVAGTGDDSLFGDANTNTLFGGAGADFIDGDDGSDVVFGDAGDDTIVGGKGINSIDGGAGIDRLSYFDSASAVTLNLLTGVFAGGDASSDVVAGIEILEGSNENGDTLTGDGLDNVLDGAGGNDTLFGGDGNDTLIYTLGADSMKGGNGVDMIDLSAIQGDALVDFFDSNEDSVIQTSGEAGQGSVLFTGGAIEVVAGTGFNDAFAHIDGHTLFGGAGDDVFAVSGVAPTIDGGAGIDLLDLSAFTTQAIVASLAAQTVSLGGAAFGAISGIEALTGSDQADTLTGDAQNNSLLGGDGSDQLIGGDGNDVLVSGSDDSAADSLSGGIGDDVIHAGSGADTVDGGAGIDILILDDAGGPAGTAILQNDGTVQFSGDFQVGAASGIEALGAHADGGTLVGNDFGNLLFVGGSGTGVIDGGAGNDTINGGGGDDTLIGGAGNDTLLGQAGADIYLLTDHGAGATLINDFNHAEGDFLLLEVASLFAGTDYQDTIGGPTPTAAARVFIYSASGQVTLPGLVPMGLGGEEGLITAAGALRAFADKTAFTQAIGVSAVAASNLVGLAFGFSQAQNRLIGVKMSFGTGGAFQSFNSIRTLATLAGITTVTSGTTTPATGAISVADIHFGAAPVISI